jgi:hypothetical protein
MPVDHPQIFLLSLRDLPVDTESYVNEFSIDTWGVTTLATCHIPSGWTITAGSSADPSGRISGAGSLGVTWLDHARVSQLRSLVLVRLYGSVQRRTLVSGTGEVPATFRGHVTIGRYGGDDKDRKVRLSWRNVSLTPAKQCPAYHY